MTVVVQLREKFKDWMEEYGDAYNEVYSTRNYKHSFPLITRDIPADLRALCSDDERYKITGSYGKGRWTSVPWIAVFDVRITTSAQKGVYIVYLLNKDTKDLYLSLILSATETIQNGKESAFSGMTGSSNKKNIAKLEKRADEIREQLKADLPCSGDIHTGSSNYDAGSIYFRKYTLEHLPDDDTLASDLRAFLYVYQLYYEKVFLKDKSKPETGLDQLSMDCFPKEVINTELSIKEAVACINYSISARGFTYPDGMVENLYLSLKSKPFVILAGISGTGKTRIAKLFAEAIGAEYKIVPVRPDWSDSSDLFGYTDLNGHFVHGAIFDFVHEAQCSPQRPYILCLDEMNLARVEYYLSDFLSVLETRELRNGTIQSAPLFAKEKYGSDQISAEKYGELFFPENLYLIGTVNMDETTFPFSKKVLDRANTIEFSNVDLNPSFTETEQDAAPLSLPNSFLRSKYLLLNQCAGEAEYVISVCAELQKLNDVLKKANLHVGYRVRDEIVFYMLNNREAEGLLAEDEAMDFEIMQKILPRIQGSTSAVKDVLCELFAVCAADRNQYTGDSDAEKMEKARKDVPCRFPKSAEKLELMTRRFEEDGFTSYWL